MEDLFKKLDALLKELGSENRAPCSRRKMMEVDGPHKPKRSVACLRQFEDLTDKDGRPRFYYATDCKVAAQLCPACAAYWHVAVAQNCLRDVQRIQSAEAMDESRQRFASELQASQPEAARKAARGKRIVTTVGPNGHNPKDESVVKYSGPMPIPGIDALLRSKVSYNSDLARPTQDRTPVEAGTALRVVGYEVEHGWLYLLCVPTSERLSVPPVYVAGCDLEPEGMRKFAEVAP